MKVSAGILVYKFVAGRAFFLLAHPGGPYYQKKEEGVWTIPKGLAEEGEDYLKTAIREFEEETGLTLLTNGIEALPVVRYKNGKWLYSYAVEADLGDLSAFKSNTFETEWPPKSGMKMVFPEIDRIAYFDAATAVLMIHPVQKELIEYIQQKKHP